MSGIKTSANGSSQHSHLKKLQVITNIYKMYNKVLAFLGVIFVISVQAKYEFTDKAKSCIKEIGTTDDIIKDLMLTDSGKFDTTNDIVRKFCGCCMRDYITDDMEIIINDDLINYVTDVFVARLDGRRKMAKLLAKDCIQFCKDRKGDTKDITAAEMMNCVITRLFEYREKN